MVDINSYEVFREWLPNYLKELQARKGLKGVEMAKLLGIHQVTYSQIVNGKLSVRMPLFLRILSLDSGYLTPEEFRVQLPQKFNKARYTVAYTLEEVAAKVGVLPRTVSRISDDGECGIELLIAVSKVLEVNFLDFFKKT